MLYVRSDAPPHPPCATRHVGFELGLLAVVVACNFEPGGSGGGASYGALMWGIWLVAASLLAAPFWFNPLRWEQGSTSCRGRERGDCCYLFPPDPLCCFLQWEKKTHTCVRPSFSSFNLAVARQDWRQWRLWLKGEMDQEVQASWHTWNR